MMKLAYIDCNRNEGEKEESMASGDYKFWDGSATTKLHGLHAFLRCRHLFQFPVLIHTNALVTCNVVTNALCDIERVDVVSDEAPVLGKDDISYKTLVHFSLPYDVVESTETQIAVRRDRLQPLNVNVKMYLDRYGNYKSPDCLVVHLIPADKVKCFDDVVRVESFCRYIEFHRIPSARWQKEFREWHMSGDDVDDLKSQCSLKLERLGLYDAQDLALMKKFRNRFLKLEGCETLTPEAKKDVQDTSNPFL
jgi:hypothetical protein